MFPNYGRDSDGNITRTGLRRVDKDFQEILQELRIAQTSTQILFVFLLTLSLNTNFKNITGIHLVEYVVTLILAFVALACLIGPVSYHRLTFHRKLRVELVRITNFLSIIGIIFFALAITSAIFFITSLTLGNVIASILTIFAASVILVVWFIIPIVEIVKDKKE